MDVSIDGSGMVKMDGWMEEWMNGWVDRWTDQ